MEELKTYPMFAGVPFKFLQWNAGSVVRRQVKAGDMLCEEGQPGSTAFLLISGRYKSPFDLRVHRCITAGRPACGRSLVGPPPPWWRKAPQHPDAPRGSIRIDGGRRLDIGQPVAVHTPEDVILGEMTCLNHYPRSATVRALEAGEVLEINRNVLFMFNAKASREIFDPRTVHACWGITCVAALHRVG